MADTSTRNYIFRLYDDGAANVRLEDWGLSGKLDANKIRTIQDVLRRGTAKIATSVPSPFARMHLFDTAFKMVADDPDGDTVYHQLVSDCLDVFQLLFQSGNSNPDITYRIWNRTERVEALQAAGPGHPHKLLADSLELAFCGKFGDVQTVTLIYYKGILLGGTSPLTVFFTSPNWQREMAENAIRIPSTTRHDVFFDQAFCPLHQRDPLFVEFMFRYYLAYRNLLQHRCVGVAEYIRRTIETHKGHLARKAASEWSHCINNPDSLLHDYARLEVVPASSTFLQLGALYGYTVKAEDIPNKIQSDSDFVIVPTVERYLQELDPATNAPLAYRPLVLARGMNVSGTYTYDNTPWNAATDIRRSAILDTFDAPIPLAQRLLPGTQIRYPFLTAEDFLEDGLIRMPYKLHKEKFFTGYPGDFPYLLPIKKEYFNFFNVEDLVDALTIRSGDRSVTVQLRIPVRNTKGSTHITFSKEYELEKAPVASCNAGLSIFPFYRITDADESLQALNEYSVLFAENPLRAEPAELAFWRVENIARRRKLAVTKPEPRSRQTAEGSSYHYPVPAAFDLIELRLRDDRRRQYAGLIIPLFNRVSNQHAAKRYTFAIDFGTSNTHVAYLDHPTDRKPKTLEIGEADLQTVLLNAPGEGATPAAKYDSGFGSFLELRSFVNREAVPVVIGVEQGARVAFPIRTATAEKATFQSEQPALFQNINIGFFIDSDEIGGDNARYQTDLKWLFENARNPADPDRIEAFLKELLLLIRNKVITTGGALRDTRVVWLCPLSMKRGSVDRFAQKWAAAFASVFKDSGARLEAPITESIAPYFFLKSNPDAGVREFADALNIDIGGGTTDVMFFMPRTSTYLSTSFRFAGGDLWGDGYHRNEKDNGFIRNFRAVHAESKRDRTLEDAILEKFLADPTLRSEDVISLLFRYDAHFRFSDSIGRQQPQLKLVLFLHYSALIYHLVQVMEQRDVAIPRYFTFTGKGSRYLDLMCSQDALTHFTKLLIGAYTEKRVPADFKVVLIANPKEATANGAALFVNSAERDGISQDTIDVVTHWGDAPGTAVGLRRNSTPLREVLADQAFHESVLRNVQAFVEKTLANEAITSFLAEYDIKGLDACVQFLTGGDATQSGELYDSYHSLLQGLRTAENDAASETFFFLALKDALYALSKRILEP